MSRKHDELSGILRGVFEGPAISRLAGTVFILERPSIAGPRSLAIFSARARRCFGRLITAVEIRQRTFRLFGEDFGTFVGVAACYHSPQVRQRVVPRQFALELVCPDLRERIVSEASQYAANAVLDPATQCPVGKLITVTLFRPKSHRALGAWFLAALAQRYRVHETTSRPHAIGEDDHVLESHTLMLRT